MEYSIHGIIPDNLNGYNDYIERMRKTEYPYLDTATYLDHAGTTLYSKTLLDRFHASLITNLYGNPHSASPSSQKSTRLIDDVRVQVLRFFNADPADFDVVFTANATAGIKLVGEALRDDDRGWDFRYHADSHTSLVGLRELVIRHECFESDEEVEGWLAKPTEIMGEHDPPTLFAYPLQSNMNGRRLPLSWCGRVHALRPRRKLYTLLDAAAYASTSSLDLSDVVDAPDFAVVSFYKIFGFPDLGALIVKKCAAHLFAHRRYFGGGTVDMVMCLKEEWHEKKTGALHEQLEDGSLPVHSIVALQAALNTHHDLFGTLAHIAAHTGDLAKRLYDRLTALKHASGRPVCKIYKSSASQYGDPTTQGPIVAFNLVDGKGSWISNAEVEKLAAIKNILLRTGGVCNPGGVAHALNLAPWEMRENLSSGHRCGSENDILNGKPTGIIRVSLGAMSTRSDVDVFVGFIEEFFVDRPSSLSRPTTPILDMTSQRFHVESLTVYPIKSCGGWQIPPGRAWEVRPEGLAWDREWCLVHQGTGKALSQKQHPRMALIRPTLKLNEGILRITMAGTTQTAEIPLSRNPNLYFSSVRTCEARVCEDEIQALIYTSPALAEFFTSALGVPCTLARYNPTSSVSRHSKAHLQPSARQSQSPTPRSILLSNESPILTISRSSLNRLNEHIKARNRKAALPSVFRPNIVLAESVHLTPGQEQPWVEDEWKGMRVGERETVDFEFLGGCRRCQMVCVDQETGERNAEPFVTLAKMRKFAGGRVLFGVHTALVGGKGGASIRAGDVVETC